ncbi:MAG: hypothetical protein S4CHLAM6_14100 [Chlamydiae bacterium]|nr:hypothetical protein [Chlamydiota bacterium]
MVKSMRKLTKYCFVLVALSMLTGCFGSRVPLPARSQLEVRQMQTHVFDVSDFKLVMKAMLNVLQDEGFVVRNVHLDLGFLTSTKEVDVEDKSSRLWTAVFGTPDTRWQKTQVIDATANITEHGKQTKVRVNFQIKQLDNFGNVITVSQIQEAVYYQDFFSKVSKSIFIQEEGI